MIKPDEIELMRLFLAGDPHAGSFAHDRVGMHEKRACRIYEKWTARGWADCGVSTRTTFLYPEGEAALRVIVAEHDDRRALIAALRAIEPDPELIAWFRAGLPPDE